MSYLIYRGSPLGMVPQDAEDIDFDNSQSVLTSNNVQNAINEIFDKIYPIGSIYLSVNSSNPATLFGGTWERVAKGRTLVGVDENDTDFDTVGETGGSKTNTLVLDQVPSHRHSIPVLSGTASSTGSAHKHNMQGDFASAQAEERYTIRQWGSSSPRWTDANMLGGGAHSHSVTTDASNTGYTGGNASSVTQPVNNLQPYLAVYIWKRTA